MNIGEISNRVAAWNEARYEREYNHTLAIKLLKEEIQEYIEADNDVEKLDALCDIIYVALGAIWKLDVIQRPNFDAYTSVMQLYSQVNFEPYHYLGALMSVLENDEAVPVHDNLWIIIFVCTAQMGYMGLDEDQAGQAMLAVCDSNDSKDVIKTASDTKANASSKGDNYFAPTEKLKKILENRHVDPGLH